MTTKSLRFCIHTLVAMFLLAWASPVLVLTVCGQVGRDPSGSEQAAGDAEGKQERKKRLDESFAGSPKARTSGN